MLAQQARRLVKNSIISIEAPEEELDEEDEADDVGVATAFVRSARRGDGAPGVTDGVAAVAGAEPAAHC